MDKEREEKIVLLVRSKHVQFDKEKLIAYIVDKKEHYATLLNTSIGLLYSAHDVVKFDPKNNEVISILSKGTKPFGGMVLDNLTNYDVDAVFAEIKDYFDYYCCQIEHLFKKYFVIATPLNMSMEKFDEIVSKCIYKIKIGIREEE